MRSCRQRIEIERVIPHLRSVVENSALGAQNYLLQRVVGIGRVGYQQIEIIDIGLVVMAVVVVERFGTDLRRKRVVGIGQRGQRKLRLWFCGCIHNG